MTRCIASPDDGLRYNCNAISMTYEFAVLFGMARQHVTIQNTTAHLLPGDRFLAEELKRFLGSMALVFSCSA